MRTMWLDYQARRPGEGWPGWFGLIIALMGAIVLVIHFMALQQDVDMLEARIAKSQRVLDRHRLTDAPDSKTKALGATLTKRLAEQGPERWETLFAALEASADDTVTLVSLNPGGSEWILTGEAKDLPATTRYVGRLQTHFLLRAARLVDYEVDKSHPQRPIRFTVAIPLGEGTG